MSAVRFCPWPPIISSSYSALVVLKNVARESLRDLVTPSRLSLRPGSPSDLFLDHLLDALQRGVRPDFLLEGLTHQRQSFLQQACHLVHQPQQESRPDIAGLRQRLQRLADFGRFLSPLELGEKTDGTTRCSDRRQWAQPLRCRYGLASNIRRRLSTESTGPLGDPFVGRIPRRRSDAP